MRVRRVPESSASGAVYPDGGRPAHALGGSADMSIHMISQT